MIKKILICFLCLSTLGVQLLNAEEKFLSLKKSKTNVRYGPGLDYPIKYIYRNISFFRINIFFRIMFIKTIYTPTIIVI